MEVFSPRRTHQLSVYAIADCVLYSLAGREECHIANEGEQETPCYDLDDLRGCVGNAQCLVCRLWSANRQPPRLTHRAELSV